MSRLLIFDEDKKNNEAKITIAKLAYMFDNTTPDNRYITATGEQQITITDGCVFAVGENGIFKTSKKILSVADLDTGSNFEMGCDYYIYMCDPLNGAIPTPTRNSEEVYKISKNSTYPSGYSATSSRKIGGFHYGRIRRLSSNGIPINTSGAEYGSGWQSNITVGIVPNSVYTVKHRPKCNPEGMVYVAGRWIDIYLSSDDGNGGFVSRYNATPFTGTEGLNWYIAVRRMTKVGKELLDHGMFVQAAFGAPVGGNDNTNAWTASSNTARCKTGNVANALSAYNIVDAVGNVWEWNNDLSYRNDGAQNWGWKSIGDDTYKGKVYTQGTYGLVAVLSGGYWSDSSSAGPCSSALNNYPWNVSTYVGARGSSL